MTRSTRRANAIKAHKHATRIRHQRIRSAAKARFLRERDVIRLLDKEIANS